MFISDERCWFYCKSCFRLAKTGSYCLSCHCCGRCVSGSKRTWTKGRRWTALVDRYTCPKCSKYTYGRLQKSELFRSLLQICWLFYGSRPLPDHELLKYSKEESKRTLTEVGQRQTEREINGSVDSNTADGYGTENDSNSLTVNWIRGGWIRKDRPGKIFKSKTPIRRKKNWLKRKPSRR